jgi:cytochrome c oxidase cbb3-type subunit III
MSLRDHASPAAEGREVVREDDHDGIRVYDNPTPGWWSFLFFATFIFSVLYFLYYHVSDQSTSVAQDYEASLAADLKTRFAEIGDLKPDRPTLLRFMVDETWKKVGASVFKTNCVSCHGTEANGLVGPNLTDQVYKNVRVLEDLPRVIAGGAGNGAMPGWKTRLHPNEIVLVASYVASLRGKDLAGPRGPEGEVIPPWPPAPPPPIK